MIKASTQPPTMTLSCSAADCRRVFNVLLTTPGERTAACPACHGSVTMNIDPGLASGGGLERCCVCGCREFFVRKDFPQRLGMALVVVAGLIATVCYYYENVPATFGVLGAVVGVDAAIYLFVGRVTVCYRCRAEYRGLPYNPEHQGFDLAASEKY